MNQNLKPLCLAFWTPPTVRPQAILIGKMIPEWIAQGVTPVIVTYEGRGHWDINAAVHTIPQFKINRWLNRIPPIRTYLRYRYQWRITQAIIEIAQQHDCNIVFSFANPQESNVIGEIVKEKTGIPFVSHFSDPWYDNPCTPMSRWRAWRVLQQETRIIKNSDAVIFINDHLRDMVMKKYPQEWRTKGAVIHHAFSPKDYPLSPEDVQSQKRKDVFTLSYVGAFYKERNPEIIFRALQKIFEREPQLKQKVRLQLVGCDSGYTDFPLSDVTALILKYNCESIVELVGRVTFQESLKYMQLADCLILIDVRYSQSYCLPSKLIDYAGSGTIIIGVANHGSPVAQFLETLGYKNFTYDEVDQLATHIHALISGQVKTERNNEFLDQFNVTITTEQLLNIFRKMLSVKI